MTVESSSKSESFVPSELAESLPADVSVLMYNSAELSEASSPFALASPSPDSSVSSESSEQPLTNVEYSNDFHDLVHVYKNDLKAIPRTAQLPASQLSQY